MWLDQGQLTGTISGSWSVEYASDDPASLQGAGELVLSRAALVGAKVSGFTVPDLSFSEARVKVALGNNRLELQEFSAAGDEVNVQASGNVTVKFPPPESVLNLRVTIQPGTKSPESVKALLALLPRPPGARENAPLSISGTLASPRVR